MITIIKIDKAYMNNAMTGMYDDTTNTYNDMTEYVQLIIQTCKMINHK